MMAPITQTSVQTNDKGGGPAQSGQALPITRHDPSRGQTSPQRGQKHTREDDPLTLQHNTKQPKTGRQEDCPPANFLDHNTTSTQHPTLVNDRSGPYPTWTTKDTPSDILNRLCPWTKEIPQRLASRLLWERSEHTPEGINGPSALILYAGADDSHSLKSAMLSISKTWPMSILEVDNKRPHKELSDDMLLGERTLRRLLSRSPAGPRQSTWRGAQLQDLVYPQMVPKTGCACPCQGQIASQHMGFS